MEETSVVTLPSKIAPKNDMLVLALKDFTDKNIQDLKNSFKEKNETFNKSLNRETPYTFEEVLHIKKILEESKLPDREKLLKKIERHECTTDHAPQIVTIAEYDEYNNLAFEVTISSENSMGKCLERSWIQGRWLPANNPWDWNEKGIENHRKYEKRKKIQFSQSEYTLSLTKTKIQVYQEIDFFIDYFEGEFKKVRQEFDNFLLNNPDWKCLQAPVPDVDSGLSQVPLMLLYNTKYFTPISKQEAGSFFEVNYTETPVLDNNYITNNILRLQNSLPWIVKKTPSNFLAKEEYYLYFREPKSGEVHQTILDKNEIKCLNGKAAGKSFLCSPTQDAILYQKIKANHKPNPVGVGCFPTVKKGNQYRGYIWYFRDELTQKPIAIINVHLDWNADYSKVNSSAIGSQSFKSLIQEHQKYGILCLIAGDFNHGAGTEEVPDSIGNPFGSTTISMLDENKPKEGITHVDNRNGKSKVYDNFVVSPSVEKEGYFQVIFEEGSQYFKYIPEYNMYQLTTVNKEDADNVCYLVFSIDNDSDPIHSTKVHKFEKDYFLKDFHKACNQPLFSDKRVNLNKWYNHIEKNKQNDGVYLGLCKAMSKNEKLTIPEIVTIFSTLDYDEFFEELKGKNAKYNLASRIYAIFTGDNLNKWYDYIKVLKHNSLFTAVNNLLQKGYVLGGWHIVGAMHNMNFCDIFENPMEGNNKQKFYPYTINFIELSIDAYIKSEYFRKLKPEQKNEEFKLIDNFKSTKKVESYHINLATIYLEDLFKKQIEEQASYYCPENNPLFQKEKLSYQNFEQVIKDFAEGNYKPALTRDDSATQLLPKSENSVVSQSVIPNKGLEFKGTLFSNPIQIPIIANKNQSNIEKWSEGVKCNTFLYLALAKLWRKNSKITIEHVANLSQKIPFDNLFNRQNEAEKKTGYHYRRNFIIEAFEHYSDEEKPNEYNVRLEQIKKTEVKITGADASTADNYLTYLLEKNLENEVLAYQSEHTPLSETNPKMDSFVKMISDFNNKKSTTVQNITPKNF